MVNFYQYHMATPKNQNKRPLEETSDEDPPVVLAWPRFLVISSSDPGNNLARMSPFLVAKSLATVISSPKNVSRMRSGDLLVEVEKEQHSNALMKLTMLYQTPVQVSPHKGLNSKKGVIRCRDIRDCTEEEIVQELASQKVTAARKIFITRDGRKLSTGTVILTFSGTTLPHDIKVGYLSVRVNPYIPNPLRCFRCQRFGHHKNNCKNEEICPKCGKNDHQEDGCQGPLQCVNCNGDHAAFSRNCPRWMEEKDLQKIKTTNNISIREAKQIQKSQKPTSHQITYATVVTQKKTSSVSTQTSITWVKEQSEVPVAPQRPAEVKKKNQATSVAAPLSSTTTPKPVTSSRQPKGSDDVIATYNRYGPLSDDEEMSAEENEPSGDDTRKVIETKKTKKKLRKKGNGARIPISFP